MASAVDHGPDAVLFDMDGTLIDSEGLWLRAEEIVMARMGTGWTEADQRECLGGPVERVAQYMVAKASSDRDPVGVGTELLDEMESLLRSTPLAWQPGARSFLDDARRRGIPTALVSASWGRLIDAVSEQVEAEVGGPAFDVVVAGDEVEESKPHPEPYLTAASALGVAPERCLVLEDSPTGVASGVAAGCRVVAIPHLAMIDIPGVRVLASLTGHTAASLWAGE
ncbi:MAG: HAD family phosphatase [Actinomycetota bacterium]|nr:HAD family phosphatase [Actinomycetota bacterium]